MPHNDQRFLWDKNLETVMIFQKLEIQCTHVIIHNHTMSYVANVVATVVCVATVQHLPPENAMDGIPRSSSMDSRVPCGAALRRALPGGPLAS